MLPYFSNVVEAWASRTGPKRLPSPMQLSLPTGDRPEAGGLPVPDPLHLSPSSGPVTGFPHRAPTRAKLLSDVGPGC